MKNVNFIMALLMMNFSHLNVVASQHFLTFIMPCYNCTRTMQPSTDSIYKQNLSIPFEVVATDVGSTAATREIL